MTLRSSATYDFTNAALTAEVAPISGIIADQAVRLAVKSYSGSSATYKYELSYWAGKIYFHKRRPGVDPDNVFVAEKIYSSVAHKFWRIRQENISGIIIAETSPDGLTWTLLGSEAVSSYFTTNIATSEIEINSGIWANVANPASFFMDNLTIKTVFKTVF